MHPRPHLRARVFAFTALYGAMLICIVLLLTWHSSRAQRAAETLISVDLRAVSQLEDLMRNQSAFASQWRSAAIGGRGNVARIGSKYDVVRQLLEIEPLASLALGDLRSSVFLYGADVQYASARWRRLSASQRRETVSRLDTKSAAVLGHARREINARRRELERKVPALRRSTRDRSVVALSVAWIIAILSFAVARITLAKVVRPVEALATAAERIAAGDLAARAPVGGDHEIRQLGEAFNRMADEIARSRQELEERARTDELTGLPNFRAFSEILDLELKRAGRYGSPFGILIADLDHFKKYNDVHGHLAGNEALRAVAAAIRGALREVDSPARYGGEEFVAVLPNTNVDEIAAVAERMRSAVETMSPPGGRDPLTISIGAAVFPADGATAQRLFAAADTRLYQAKAAGRNRGVVPAGARPSPKSA